MFQLELGALVKDKVTGFKGKIIARTEWLYGCRRYTVQPEGINKEGKLFDTANFDEDSLEVVKSGVSGTVKDSGGPQPNVPRAPGVKR